MSNIKQGLYQEGSEGTRVDLGSDLLEKTALFLGQDAIYNSNPINKGTEFKPNQGESVSDLLQSAKILVNEGLTEDAKKILHQILILESSHLEARQFLDIIQNDELKQILTDRDIPRHYRRAEELPSKEVDIDEILRKLDADLDLGVIKTRAESGKMEELSFLQDLPLLVKFCDSLEQDLQHSSIVDLIDLGIAFQEMEIYLVAERLFRSATHRILTQSLVDTNLLISSQSLLASTLLKSGRPFDALSSVESLMRDNEIEVFQKLELYYLIGTIYECMKKYDIAVEFYKKVIYFDPNYRDSKQRLEKISLN